MSTVTVNQLALVAKTPNPRMRAVIANTGGSVQNAKFAVRLCEWTGTTIRARPRRRAPSARTRSGIWRTSVLADLLGHGTFSARHPRPKILTAFAFATFGRVLLRATMSALRGVQTTNIAVTSCVRLRASLASTSGIVHSCIATIGLARHILEETAIARGAIPGILAIATANVSFGNTSVIANTRFCCITALTGVAREWSRAVTSAA